MLDGVSIYTPSSKNEGCAISNFFYSFNDDKLERNEGKKKNDINQHRNSWSAGQSTYRSQATEVSDIEMRADLPGSLLTPPPGPRHDIPLDYKPCIDEIVYLVVGGKKFKTCWRALLRFPMTKLGLFTKYFQKMVHIFDTILL